MQVIKIESSKALEIDGILRKVIRFRTVALALDRTAFSLENLLSYLEEDERAICFSYVRLEDRIRYGLGHSVVNEIYKKYLKAHSIKALRSVNEYGKPRITGGLNYNISHSGKWVLIGLSIEGEIGVDVEYIDPSLPYRCIVNNVFPKLQSKPGDSRLEFYKHWVGIEAYVKALGKGLSYPVDQLFIEYGLSGVGAVHDPKSHVREQIVLFEPGPEHIGAVCVLRGDGNEGDIQ